MVRLPCLDTIVEVNLPRDPFAARIVAQYIVSAPPAKERFGEKPVRRPGVWAASVAEAAAAAPKGSSLWKREVDGKVDYLRDYFRASRGARPAWLDDAALMEALLDGRAPDGSVSMIGAHPDEQDLVAGAVAAVVGHSLRACTGPCQACELAREGDWTGALHAQHLASDPLWDLLTALQQAHVMRSLAAPSASTVTGRRAAPNALRGPDRIGTFEYDPEVADF